MITFTLSNDDARVLHMDETCLFHVAPREPLPEDVCKASARLMAQSRDSMVGIDGTRIMPCCHYFGSLQDALSILLAAGATIGIRLPEHTTPADSDPARKSWSVRVHRTWDAPRELVESATQDPTSQIAGADERIAVDMEGHSEWYDIVVDGLPKPLSAVDTLEWKWILRTPQASIRVALERSTSADWHFSTLLYCGGVLGMEDDKIATDVPSFRGVRLHVDVLATASSFTRDDPAREALPKPPSVVALPLAWIPDFPETPRDAEADEFGAQFLCAHAVAQWSKSALVRALMMRARPWRFALRQKWRYHGNVQFLLNAMSDPNVATEFLALADASQLLQHTARNERLHITGMAILNRMRSSGASFRSVDWCATAIAEHGVSQFAMMGSITAAQFARLESAGATLGMEASMGARTCPYGILYDDGSVNPLRSGVTTTTTTRTILLPNDADAMHVTMAVAHLCAVSEGCEAECETTPPDIIDIPFEKLHSEQACRCDPESTLTPYRVSLDASNGVRLTRDEDLLDDVALARDAMAIDVMEEQVRTECKIPRAEERSYRDLLMGCFPKLAERLRKQHHSPLACFAEAQARRVVSEWTLEGVEDYGNMSSLGLSVLVALALGGWTGADVRVFVSPLRAAVVGYRVDEEEVMRLHPHAETTVTRPPSATGGFRLIDPTRSVRNAFHMAPSLLELNEVWGLHTGLHKGSLVEVRIGNRWRAAQVRYVTEMRDTARVYVMSLKMDMIICPTVHAIRALARSTDSDTGHVLRSLLKKRTHGGVVITEFDPNGQDSEGEYEEDAYDYPCTRSVFTLTTEGVDALNSNIAARASSRENLAEEPLPEQTTSARVAPDRPRPLHDGRRDLSTVRPTRLPVSSVAGSSSGATSSISRKERHRLRKKFGDPSRVGVVAGGSLGA